MKTQNKWICGAIPALLLHCSIGTVYCWSIFSQEIANYIGFSKSAVEWAFSFAIFFLGMSAAFLGGLVEKNIHKSSLIASITFALGMLGTGYFIWYGGKCAQLGQPSIASLIGIYVCYGFIMGIGLGTGYLSPVKTLMLWFKDRKGLATGLAVAGFGAAKAIASPIMQAMLDNMGPTGIYKMFYILAGIYFIFMMIGHFMLAKPKDWIEPQIKTKETSVISTLKSKPILSYIGIWLMFYINITCGLAIISQEKMIVNCIGLGSAIGLISTISAIFNAGGRICFSAWADKLKDRNTIYKIIFLLSIVSTILVVSIDGIINVTTLSIIFVLALIFIINAGYGGGFSNIPTLLSDHYGMGNISAIHGITLSAWAFAGLTGNQLATFIVNHSGQFVNVNGISINPIGYQNVLVITAILYIIALVLSYTLVVRKTEPSS